MNKRISALLWLLMPVCSAAQAVPANMYMGEAPRSLNLWEGNWLVIGGDTYFSNHEYFNRVKSQINPFGWSPNANYQMTVQWSSVNRNGQADGSFYFTSKGLGNYDIGLPVGKYYNFSTSFSNGFAAKVGPVYYGENKLIVPTSHSYAGYVNKETAVHWLETTYGQSDVVTAAFIMGAHMQRAMGETGMLATNIYNKYPASTHASCAAWYDFASVRIDDDSPISIGSEADFRKLKKGITFVKEITWCGRPEAETTRTKGHGCAEQNGSVIAISVSTREKYWHNVMLHEIGHAQGLEHDDKDSTNIMWGDGVDDTRVNITPTQCVGLQQSRN